MAAVKTKAKAKAKAKTKARARTKKPPKPTKALRLERGEGDARVFWEIALLDCTVTTRAGRYLYEGRVSSKAYGTTGKADAAYEAAITAKRADGYGEPTPKEVIGGSSRKGVATRNPELEAMIEEDPSDLSRYLIYADWLQQQGDPRGELIIAQHKLAHTPTTAKYGAELDALEHIEWKLFREFARELLGPLAKHTVTRSGTGSTRGLGWRCGFIRAAALHSADAVAALLDHPSGRFLEMLAVEWYATKDVCAVLEKKAPKTFRTLAVQTRYAGAELGMILPLFSRLKNLWITGPITSIGEAAAHAYPSVEEVNLGFLTPWTLAQIVQIEWPSLKRFAARFAAVDELDPQALKQVLAMLLAKAPALEYVQLRRSNAAGAYIPASQQQWRIVEAVLQTFRDTPHKVTQLDLQVPVTRESDMLRAIATDLPKTLRLTMPVRSLTNPVERSEWLSKVKGMKFIPGEPAEPILDDVASFHHERPNANG